MLKDAWAMLKSCVEHVLSKWLGYTDSSKNIIVTMPHWAKQWTAVNGINGYQNEILEFKRIHSGIGRSTHGPS